MASAVPATATALSADVVICTYTLARWALLARAVESVLAQKVAPQQLIIVVDHNDELLARCRQEWGAGSADSPFEIVVAASQFHSRQASSRNTGLLLARAEIVSFLDDDAEAEPDWLERLLAVYTTHPGAVAVGGAARPNYSAPRPSWFPPEFEWVFGCHYQSLPDRLAPTRHLIGTSMSVRRDEMLAVGGFHFDEFDDMDLSHRIAHEHGPAAVLYEPRAEVHHYVPPERMTWSYFWRRCFSVNRNKVGALVDMGESGNIVAELRFGVGVLLALVPALLAAVAGRRERARQALAALAGLVLAGCGYITGRVQLARGRRPEILTTGLSVAEVRRVRAAVPATDDA
jgi:cellulose synthase/poly-beta-1,6-N-acetylglucosamine synthase-like glycosyltransferase